MQAEHNPPPGFQRMAAPSGFVTLCGSFYADAERRILAARITRDHLNPLGIAHGGLLATLADTAFGFAIKLASGAGKPPATISLHLDYLSPAHEGDWVEAHVDIEKQGARIANASCQLRAGERLIAKASAIFIGQGGR